MGSPGAHFGSKLGSTKGLIPKIRKKSPIHENTNAKITCDFGDERFRIAAARLEKDISVRTRLHTARIVVRISATFFTLVSWMYLQYFLRKIKISATG